MVPWTRKFAFRPRTENGGRSSPPTSRASAVLGCPPSMRPGRAFLHSASRRCSCCARIRPDRKVVRLEERRSDMKNPTYQSNTFVNNTGHVFDDNFRSHSSHSSLRPPRLCFSAFLSVTEKKQENAETQRGGAATKSAKFAVPQSGPRRYGVPASAGAASPHRADRHSRRARVGTSQPPKGGTPYVARLQKHPREHVGSFLIALRRRGGRREIFVAENE